MTKPLVTFYLNGREVYKDHIPVSWEQESIVHPKSLGRALRNLFILNVQPAVSEPTPRFNSILTGVTLQTWDDMHRRGRCEPVQFDKVGIEGWDKTLTGPDFMKAANLSQGAVNLMLARKFEHHPIFT